MFVLLKKRKIQTEKYLKKGNDSNNHTDIFPFLVQGHCNHTEKKNKSHCKKSALLFSDVHRTFCVTLDFQCEFQCHNIALVLPMSVLTYQLVAALRYYQNLFRILQ